MKAAVLHSPGGPDALKIEDRPLPVPRAGEVFARIGRALPWTAPEEWRAASDSRWHHVGWT